jgi:hypothetical protein
MIFTKSLISTLLASASLVLSLPVLDRDVVNLSVRDDDHDVEYKRSPVEMFVCKRDGDKYGQLLSPLRNLFTLTLTPFNSQSLSCLRKKSGADALDVDSDQSKTANV